MKIVCVLAALVLSFWIVAYYKNMSVQSRYYPPNVTVDEDDNVKIFSPGTEENHGNIFWRGNAESEPGYKDYRPILKPTIPADLKK